jgi:hypothetical protein
MTTPAKETPKDEKGADHFEPKDEALIRAAMLDFYNDRENDAAERNRAFAIFQVMRAEQGAVHEPLREALEQIANFSYASDEGLTDFGISQNRIHERSRMVQIARAALSGELDSARVREALADAAKRIAEIEQAATHVAGCLPSQEMAHAASRLRKLSGDFRWWWGAALASLRGSSC